MLTSWLSPLVLLGVIVVILWRPRRVNEAVPATVGAAVLLASGVITLRDLDAVVHIVSGPGLTILATILMSAVLDQAGFFRWAAVQLARKADGSGRRLFGLTLALCFCMTMFFNNDGSILITTPIILELTRRLGFTKAQALPYLIGGCLVATSASAPIGVSNLANLIALNIVGLNLNQYAALMLVPSLLGIAVCALLLYAVFRRRIPDRFHIPNGPPSRVFPPRPGDTWHLPKPGVPRPAPKRPEPHRLKPTVPPPGGPTAGRTGLAGSSGRTAPAASLQLIEPAFDPLLSATGIAIVVLVRAGFFIGAAHGIPVQVVAIAGACLLLGICAVRRPRSVAEIARTAPWYILAFAFGMYALIYGLQKQGITLLLGRGLELAAGQSLLAVVLLTGLLLTVMSCLFNNLPSVMIGTVMLTDLHLPAVELKLAYLSNVLGSDIGSLLLPMGTLASLLWFHLVRQPTGVTWADYMRFSFAVIPPSLAVSLLALYGWSGWLLR